MYIAIFVLNISKNNGVSDFDFLCGLSHNWLMQARFRLRKKVKPGFTDNGCEQGDCYGGVVPVVHSQREWSINAYSSCSNSTRIASYNSFTVKFFAGVVKIVSSPAMVPRMPSALPKESSRRAISCAAPGLV